jgi:hypothetical protein
MRPIWLDVWILWCALGVIVCAFWSVLLRRQFKRERSNAQEKLDHAHVQMVAARERAEMAALRLANGYRELAHRAAGSDALEFYERSAAYWDDVATMYQTSTTPLAERSSQASRAPSPPSLPSRIAERPDPKREGGDE